MRENIYAKKSLGQHFLKSKEALRQMIAAADLTEKDIVLEIGPGKGVLTAALIGKVSLKSPSESATGESAPNALPIKAVQKVIAVEKDERMIAHLRERFTPEISSGRLEIIQGDILDIDPAKIGLKIGDYKIVANIPYYITGQFLRKFLSGDCQPSRMVLMVQKEVAKRIAANGGGRKNTGKDGEKESILSLSVKVYGTPKYVATVQKKYFSPPPKVDSAILLISDISKKFFGETWHDEESLVDEGKFFALIKKGFAHKRKMLAQNLEIPPEKRSAIFTGIGANEKARAEELSIDQWKKLCGLL